MLSPSNWHNIPAGTIEAIIIEKCGTFPPTLASLEALASSVETRVSYHDRALITTPITLHREGEIFMPAGRAALLVGMLAHEVTEVLLRKEVAEQFTYPPSNRDDFHLVALAVEKRIRAAMSVEIGRLSAELVSATNAFDDAVNAAAAMSEQLARYVAAVREAFASTGVVTQPIAPSPSMLAHVTATLCERSRAAAAIGRELAAYTDSVEAERVYA